MYNIKTLNKISKNGLDKFTENYNVADEVEKPDGILLRSFDMLNYDFNEELLCIGRAGAGVNNIPLDRCSEKGIVVFNTPGANANAVKELVICGLLLGSRKIQEGVEWTKTVTDTENIHKLVEKEKAKFGGVEIQGKTLGVIGLGAIGVLCANAGSSLGMEVIGYDPFISIDSAWNLSKDIKKSTDLDEIYAKCDYITLHIPYLESTKGTINKDSLEKCKDGVVILNFARGELVNNEDIITYVKNGKVGKYITDFPKKELLGIENIINIPHLGASTFEAEENCAFMAVNQVRDYIENGNIKNSVNFPAVSMPFRTDNRIAVINEHKPTVISDITKILAQDGLNVQDMINKSRDNVGYILLDITGELNNDTIDKIKAVDGVLKVRIIKK